MAIQSVGDLLHFFSSEEAAGNCLPPGSFLVALGNNHLLGRHMLNVTSRGRDSYLYPGKAGGGREEGEAL